MADDELGWSAFERLPEELRKAAYDSVEEVLDERTKAFTQQLKNTTPVSSKGRYRGSTKQSITIVKVDKETKRGGKVIGYRVIYDGFHLPEKDGGKKRPFQVIANSLNRGFYNNHGYYVPGRYFIDRAVSLLKGMDDEIDKKFDDKVKKIKIGE